MENKIFSDNQYFSQLIWSKMIETGFFYYLSFNQASVFANKIK